MGNLYAICRRILRSSSSERKRREGRHVLVEGNVVEDVCTIALERLVLFHDRIDFLALQEFVWGNRQSKEAGGEPETSCFTLSTGRLLLLEERKNEITPVAS
jgi:hypothetical protein